jgi:hypothetical protein
MVNITDFQKTHRQKSQTVKKTQPFKLLFKKLKNAKKRIRWGSIGNKSDFKGEFLISTVTRRSRPRFQIIRNTVIIK